MIAVHAGAVRYGGFISRRGAEKIADDVLACADTDTFIEQVVTDDVFDLPGALDSVRAHMRDLLAMQALREGYLLTALPHEVIDRAPGSQGWFMRRIRLIAPVRKAPTS